MKGKSKKEKEEVRLRFAVALKKALDESSLNSVRELAAEASLEPAHVQRIANGKVDFALSTQVCLAEGLNLTQSELSAYYDKVTQEDIDEFLDQKKEEKKEREKRKANRAKRGEGSKEKRNY